MSRLQAAGDMPAMLELNSRANVMVGTLVYPLLAFAFVFAEEIVTIIYTAAYVDAAPVMRVYIVGLAAMVVELASVMMLLRQGAFVLRLNLVALILSVALSWYAAHQFGFAGAAVGSVTAIYIEIGATLRRIALRTGIPFRRLQDWRTLGLLMLFAALAGAFAWGVVGSYFDDSGPLVRLAFGGAVHGDRVRRAAGSLRHRPGLAHHRTQRATLNPRRRSKANMCGIAGWVARPESALTGDTLESMLQAIAHRGPDDQGVCAFRCAGTGHRVFLGHRRLAIIDPEGAHQPMCDAAAGLALTFNGEIYNFRELRAQLVEARAIASPAIPTPRYCCARTSNGGRKSSTTCAACSRSRSGMRATSVCSWRATASAKSRYSCTRMQGGCSSPRRSRRCCAFRASWRASTCRPSRTISRIATCRARRTLFTGIRKLMPGTCVTWERGRLSEGRYWSAPDRIPRASSVLAFERRRQGLPAAAG